VSSHAVFLPQHASFSMRLPMAMEHKETYLCALMNGETAAQPISVCPILMAITCVMELDNTVFYSE
jgi:hypothetical protein